MDLTIESVHDIIRIINAYPQWRQEIRDSLFPEIDLPKAFRELAEAQRRTEQSVRELSQTVRELAKTQREMAEENRKSQLLLKHHTTQIARLNSKMVEAAKERQAIRDDLGVLKHGQNDLRHGQDHLRRGLDDLKHNQNDLRGRTYEQQIRNRANAVFGRFLKRGRNMRNEIGDHLEEAEENGQLSDPEHEQVLACDLLWGGKLKSSKEELFLVVKVSWSAEESDIQRAAKRAQILRSIGLNALGVVAGIHWTPEVAEQALFEGVVVVSDMRLDKDSWQAALALLV